MRAEELLRKSKERFREFFENEPVYGYMISPEGIILDLNKAALKVLGYTKDDLLGRHWKMIYTPESLTKAKQLFTDRLRTGTVKDEEMTIITKPGDMRLVLLSVNTVKDNDGETLYLLAVQEDITQIKDAEESLRKANRTLMVLSTCASAMVHTGDELACLMRYAGLSSKSAAIPWPG